MGKRITKNTFYIYIRYFLLQIVCLDPYRLFSVSPVLPNSWQIWRTKWYVCLKNSNSSELAGLHNLADFSGTVCVPWQGLINKAINESMEWRTVSLIVPACQVVTSWIKTTASKLTSDNSSTTSGLSLKRWISEETSC